jgi:hypothetical protein
MAYSTIINATMTQKKTSRVAIATRAGSPSAECSRGRRSLERYR